MNLASTIIRPPWKRGTRGDIIHWSIISVGDDIHGGTLFTPTANVIYVSRDYPWVLPTTSVAACPSCVYSRDDAESFLEMGQSVGRSEGQLN